MPTQNLTRKGPHIMLSIKIQTTQEELNKLQTIVTIVKAAEVLLGRW